MQLQPSYQALDVGCGPGTDTIPLAQIVGPQGQVVGVDHDEAMIAEADQRAEQASVATWVKHTRADVASLPFERDRFDACRSERLFQHLLEPELALSEMSRVTKRGGWLVVLDTDWGTISIDTSEVDIERRLARVLAERVLHNGYSGRRLYRLFKQQGLADISIEMFPTHITSYALLRQVVLLDRVEQEALASGIVTNDELDRWRFSLEQAEASGVCFGSGTLVMAAGRKT
jgi:ubiquinone/menaquinone biosynthesis C-methylase UbiE